MPSNGSRRSKRGSSRAGPRRNRRNDGRIDYDGSSLRMIPAIRSTITCVQRFRFVCNSAIVHTELLDTDLFYLVGCAVNSTTLSPLFGSVRLLQIEAWAADTSAANDDSIQFEFKSNNPAMGASSRCFIANSISAFQLAHLRVTPPAGSYAKQWLQNSGYWVVWMTIPQHTIVDFTLEFSIFEDSSPNTDPSVNSGLTTGQIYCHTLPQSLPGSLLPEGWSRSL